MGVQYALVHDGTREAFELGKGFIWGEWRQFKHVPASKSALEAELRVWAISLGEPDADISRLVDQLWAFIESHPGSRIVDDGCNWWTTDAAEAAAEDPGGDSVWFQVGSRYVT